MTWFLPASAPVRFTATEPRRRCSSSFAAQARYGNETRKIRAGDVICCPTGGPETAHQIVNDSDEELAYVSVSTMMPAEVCEYPDSKKIGAYGDGGLRHMTRASEGVDYWIDEI